MFSESFIKSVTESIRGKPMKAKKNKMMPKADMAKKEAMKQDRKMMGKKIMKGKK